MYEHKADSELLQLLKQDDRAAFNALYKRHWERLYTIAYSRLQRLHAAEDIVQEVFASLWANRSRKEIHILENYLATAVLYSTLKQLAKERRMLTVEHERLPQLATESTAATLLDDKSLLRLIQDETNKLPEQCQLIFRKSREEDMTVHQIASELNLSPHTVTNQLTKALGRLRKSLKAMMSFLPLPL